jgi:hypothetical protein
MRSLISVNFTSYIYLLNLTFKENWMFEPYFTDSRGLLLYTS